MAKQEEQKVPNLRFKGFHDEWEQRKLDNKKITSLITKGSTPRKSQWQGPVNFIKTNNISLNSGKIKPSIHISLSEHTNYLKRSKLQENDLLFSIVGTLGIVGKVDSKILPANTNQQIAIIRLKDNINSEFLLNEFQTSRIKKWIKSQTTIGAQPSISLWQIKEIQIFLPNNYEKIKVCKILTLISDLISLQQRRLTLLKQFKKGLLQKMFADKDSKRPVLRFAGFHDDWKLQKGNRLFISKSDKGYPKLPVLSATQDKGMILRNKSGIDIKYKKKSLSSYKRVQPGDFVVHLRSFQGGFAYSSIKGIASPAYTIFTFKKPQNFDNNFWKEKFTSYNFIQLLKKVTYGVRDGRSISYTDFLTLYEKFPTKQEQSKIGNIFQQIDNLISLQQRRLTLLKQFKKSLLQQMFI